MMVAVSVIIPNYNHAPFLKKRIDSILAQTFQDLEIIILDDHSTDNSREVIETYRGNPMVSHIEYNKQNSGSTFLQWQKGMLLAKGKYIWIAESDDFCEPTFLAELVPPLENSPASVLAFCQSLLVSPEGFITHRTLTDKLFEQVDGEGFVKRSMLGTNTIVNASMAVFRKDKALTVPTDYQQMRYCGDWLFWVHLCLLGDVLISGKYLNYYLRHLQNVASTATRKGLDFLEGNRIYHFITDRIAIDAASKQHALEERALEYMRTRSHFADDKVAQEVWDSVAELDPAIKNIIKGMIWREKRVQYAMKLKKLLTGHP